METKLDILQLTAHEGWEGSFTSFYGSVSGYWNHLTFSSHASFQLFPPNKQSHRVPGVKASKFILQLKSNNLEICLSVLRAAIHLQESLNSENMEKERKRWTKLYVLQDEPPNHCYKASVLFVNLGQPVHDLVWLNFFERNENQDRIMGMDSQHTFMTSPSGWGCLSKGWN